jgi:NAD(P)-dependent dehydrogenase (short-subunit alcohol dehydrogenase family)
MASGERTAIVTGATGALGREAAATIAAADGWQVVLAARNPERLPTDLANAHPRRLDLASLASVRAFVDELDDTPPLGAIICNAGIQIVSGTTFTEDGIETTFQVNHLGHFLLVTLLLDRLDPDGRVVMVSSGTHNPDQRTGMPHPRYTTAEDLAHPQPADTPVEGRRRYTTSKLCNVLFVSELARRRPIAVNAFDPGLMPGTGLARDYGPVQRAAWKTVMRLLTPVVPNVNTPARSGRSLARLAVDPVLDGVTGAYFLGDRPVASSTDSYDRRKARDLWETSERLVVPDPP